MGADGATTVRLCGPLSVELSGREAVMPGRQGRLAFAYLVVNRRRAVGRDELIDLLWPERLPADPGEALSALLSRVRRAVGADVLTGRRELELVLPAEAWVDLEAALSAAERADSALAAADLEGAWSAAGTCVEIARGGFLAGDEAPWAHDRRRDVHELRLRALEARAAAGIGLGGNRLADAERAAREAIEAAPFRETGHRLLMAALAARGNVAEALRAYECLRVLLRDELGTAPGADVQALHRRLLTEGAATAGWVGPIPRSREERRLVTVLCAELAQPAAPLDPEELGPVEAEAQRRACAVVEGFGATAHALSAGGLVAVFGAPVAHEDDAERAVRAALRLCELCLAARAGVASGEAIVALGGPEEGRATGAVTSAAAALQRAAPPGGTAVDDATRAATADALCFEPIAGTPPGWRATGEPAAPPRPTPFVGRDHELALLRELHDATLSEGRPHLVTIVGEAGIGKSRLLEELSSRVALETGAAVHRGRCLAYGEGIAYWPLREILWDAAGILLDDSAVTAAAKLTGLVGELLAPDGDDAAEAQRTASALAAGAGLTLPGSTLADATPESVAEEIGLAWPRFLSALAARAPTVVAIEDLHWAEPALLDMVEAILARSHGPLLVVATARPELAQARASWGQRPGTWQVALHPLDAQAARDLVADILPGVDAPLAARVVEVAEGNPFYAEEIARHLEHGGSAEPEIPATVRALLAARIDALPEAEQDVLQHAAVVGRRFWPSALEPTWRQEPLAPALRSLERRGFIVARATSSLPGERELAFVHGLTREVAYRSIPRGARCRVHAAVATWLEALAGDRRDEFVALLAHHYEAAAAPADAALAWPGASPEPEQLRVAAVRALVEAGEAARRRLALAQALRFADRALALADAPAERLAALELRARSHHAAVHGNQALEAYLAAIELARALGDADTAARLRGHATLLCSRYPGSFIGEEWKAHADDLVDRGLAEAGEDGVDFATAALLIGRAWGTWRWRDPIAEDLPRAKRDAERAAEIAEAIGSSLLVSVALEALTWIAFSQGDCEAVALGERHLHAAATLADRFEAHESLNMAAICFVRAGRFDRAREIAAEAARQAPAMSAHRALHAVASQAIALVPGGNFEELLDATHGVEELIAEEREHICANALVALATRAVVLHESGQRSAAEAALELFDRVAPPDRPLVRWGPWIVEMLRAVAGLESTLGRLGHVEVRHGAGNAVDVLRTELLTRAAAGEWDRAEDLAGQTRALAGSTCAPALGFVADWADAMRLADDGHHARALEVGVAATAALAERGERYPAARLMTDLLARLGDAAPPDLVALTAQRLQEMGAHSSAAAARALAYARDAGA
jgi:DNA-binding SARP family transcriptional activator/tetratricopeptide (TPR) repeat protein